MSSNIKIKFNDNVNDIIPIGMYFTSVFLTSKAGYVNKTYLQGQQSILIALLNIFQSNPNMDTLKDLCIAGFECYTYFLNCITTNGKGEYRREFEGVFKKRRDTEYILSVEFSTDFSFPIGLFFVVNPNKINDWTKTNIKNIVTKFLSFMVRIRYSYERDSGISKNIQSLSNGSMVLAEVIHAIDDSLDTNLEQQVWSDHSKSLISTPVYDTNSLVGKWLTKQLAIIHFSSHLRLSPHASYPYIATLSNNEFFTPFDLKKSLLSKNIPKHPPLVFLNMCQSGIMHSDYKTNFITDLFPSYSLGFVTTSHDVLNHVAGEMAKIFYEYFVSEGRPLLEAIEAAKEFLILEKEEYSAMGYALWEGEPSLLFKEKKLIKRELSKKSKISYKAQQDAFKKTRRGKGGSNK